MHIALGESDPKVIGSYRLDGRLGVGGAGIVYLGVSPTGMRVAVKVLRSGLLVDPEHRKRFAREVRAAQSVPPFCTAEIIEADTDSDTPYLVTQFIDGLTLAESVRTRGPLAGSELDYVAFGMAGALVAIHKAKITHRDLSPKNVILGPLGLRVIDFGLALLSEIEETISGPGQVVGTQAYMAPEQRLGQRVESSADVYSWGAVVSFAASGRPPQEAGEVAVDGPLGEIVQSALNRVPSERPSAAEILDRLLVRLDSPSEFLIRATAGSGRSVRPQTALGWAEQARQDLEDGRLRLALFKAQEGRRLDSLNARCHYYEGLAQIELDEPQLGVNSIRLAYEIDSSDRVIALGYARYLSATSLEGSRQAYAIAPDDHLVRARYLLWSAASSEEGQALGAGVDDVVEAFRLAPTEPEARRRFVQLLSQGPDAVHKTYQFDVDKERVSAKYLESLLSQGRLLAAVALVKAAHPSLTSSEGADWQRKVVTRLREEVAHNENRYSDAAALLIAEAAQQAAQVYDDSELARLQDIAFGRKKDEAHVYRVGCGGLLVALVGIDLAASGSVAWIIIKLVMAILFVAVVISALLVAPPQLRRRRRAHATRQLDPQGRPAQ